jgi:hypothetical protein
MDDLKCSEEAGRAGGRIECCANGQKHVRDRGHEQRDVGSDREHANLIDPEEPRGLPVVEGRAERAAELGAIQQQLQPGHDANGGREVQ